MAMRDRFKCVATGVLAVAVFGCGKSEDVPDVHPVTANVTLDGEPFGPTSIRLIPPVIGEGRSVHGKVDASGNVVFTTFDVGDGAPANTYKVVVGQDFGAPPKPFPAVYQKEDQTPLEVTVTADGENNLTIAMDSSVGGPMVEGGADFGSGGPDPSKAMQDPAFSAGANPSAEPDE